MGQLILLFIRQVPVDNSNGSNPKGEPMLMAGITTPLGKLTGIRASQLEIMQVPFISENGRVGRVPMKRLYLDQVLDNLASDLNMDLFTLLDGSREIVIVTKEHVPANEERVPCYYGSTANPVNMKNFQNLEANVMRCLDQGLDSLPSDILYNWLEIVLNRIFEQARAVISGKAPEHP